MKLGLLFVDELLGFYKSKVMIFLWIGLPIIALLFRFVSESSSNIPFTLVSSIVVSSLAGTLASVMLAVFIINEKNRHVYELFLIRPLKRRDIILAKFFSVYTCVAIASLIAVLAGMITDYATTGTLSMTILNNAGQSLATGLSMIAVSCAAGVLIGVASPSVLVGAILVIYGGNQISVIPLVPTLLNLQDATVFTIVLAGATAAGLLAAAVALFERKQF
ncbi:MAG: ABC-2 transporter permease [Candidatus Bathyarchaeia archaeon]|jgi:ABC-2 type transport system permease protein